MEQEHESIYSKLVKYHNKMTKVLLNFPDCLPTGLLAERVPTAALTIGNGIRVKLRPQNTVKILRLNVALEDDNGQELYELQITEHMEVVWGDMEVTLRDSKSHNNILKVKYLYFVYDKQIF